MADGTIDNFTSTIKDEYSLLFSGAKKSPSKIHIYRKLYHTIFHKTQAKLQSYTKEAINLNK